MSYVYTKTYVMGYHVVKRFKVIKTLPDGNILAQRCGTMHVISQEDVVCEAPDPWWIVAFQVAVVVAALYGILKCQ